MNMSLLEKHIATYKKHLQEDRERHAQDLDERKPQNDYYQAWTKYHLQHQGV